MSAPGYNSMRWIRQDWRFIRMSFVDGEPFFDFSKRCGSKGGEYPRGNARLCLPATVIRQLIRSDSGVEALRKQVRAKQRAKKGERVPYNDLVLKKYRSFVSRDKFQDLK